MKVSSNRLDLMDTVTVDGIQEKDPLTMQVRDFVARRQVGQHVAHQVARNRPFLISIDEYNSAGYWWFILAINNIVDPYEVPQNVKLKIPSIDDYYDWFRDQKGTT